MRLATYTAHSALAGRHSSNNEQFSCLQPYFDEYRTSFLPGRLLQSISLVRKEHFAYDRSMDALPDLSTIGALIGDPARAAMLSVLMDGRALTATELAYFAGVTPQTASSHLAKLQAAKLLRVEVHGRHRYYCLAGTAVAEAVEAMMVLAAHRVPPRRPPVAPLQADRLARTCYDHLAGTLGVSLATAMVENNYLVPEKNDFRLTATGERFMVEMGVAVAQARNKRRAFARQCLDWSERRPHLAGALGAAFAARCFELRWVRHSPEGRALVITPKGRKACVANFGVEVP